jgi:hypothetical protein
MGRGDYSSADKSKSRKARRTKIKTTGRGKKQQKAQRRALHKEIFG